MVAFLCSIGIQFALLCTPPQMCVRENDNVAVWVKKK